MPYVENPDSIDDVLGDIFDTRQIVSLVEHLESVRDDEDADEDDKAEAVAELARIADFVDELSGSPDYPYGETVIHEDYFTTYAQELAEDIGALPKDLDWPASYIDWGRAADALKQDYMTADFEGVTYYVRA